MPLEKRGAVRAAAMHAGETAATVVDIAYTTAGTTAIYRSSPLQRQLRDVRAVTQHIAVAPGGLEIAGRALLGLDPGVPVF